MDDHCSGDESDYRIAGHSSCADIDQHTDQQVLSDLCNDDTTMMTLTMKQIGLYGTLQARSNRFVGCGETRRSSEYFGTLQPRSNRFVEDAEEREKNNSECDGASARRSNPVNPRMAKKKKKRAVVEALAARSLSLTS